MIMETIKGLVVVVGAMLALALVLASCEARPEPPEIDWATGGWALTVGIDRGGITSYGPYPKKQCQEAKEFVDSGWEFHATCVPLLARQRPAPKAEMPQAPTPEVKPKPEPQ